MDNLTHSLAGWALGQTGLKRRTRKGLAALILSANMPDIDVFFGWAPWRPLATHRGFTHGLGGILILPLLLAALLWLLDRRQAQRGREFRSGLPMHLPWLIGLSYLGALTHPALDFCNTYGIQLLAPFSSTWFHGDTLFIVDVWLWSLVAGGIALSRRWERQGRRSWGRPAQAALLLALAYIGGNALWSQSVEHRTYRQVELARGARPDLVIAGELPVAFWERSILWRQGGEVGFGRAAPGSFQLDPGAVPTNMGDPLVARAVAQNPRLQRFLYWSIAPVARIERRRCAAEVVLTDARFSGSGLARAAFLHHATVPIAGPGCAPSGAAG